MIERWFYLEVVHLVVEWKPVSTVVPKTFGLYFVSFKLSWLTYEFVVVELISAVIL